MVALQTASTHTDGWEDFVIDLADFAEYWAGVPMFSQSRAVRALPAPGGLILGPGSLSRAAVRLSASHSTWWWSR